MKYLRLVFIFISLLIFNSCFDYTNKCSWNLDKKNMIHKNNKNRMYFTLFRPNILSGTPYLYLNSQKEIYSIIFIFEPGNGVVKISNFRFSIYETNNIILITDSIINSVMGIVFYKNQIKIKNLRKRQDGESLWFDFEVTLHFSNGKTSKLYYKKEKITKIRVKKFDSMLYN